MRNSTKRRTSEGRNVLFRKKAGRRDRIDAIGGLDLSKGFHRISEKIGSGIFSAILAGLILLIVFGVFVLSLIPQQIRLHEGDVASINVKAPQEVIDDGATQRLKDEIASGVPEVWGEDKNVLIGIKKDMEALKEIILESSVQSERPTGEVLSSIRQFLSSEIVDADILAVVASSQRSVNDGFTLLSETLEDVLKVGLKPENLEKGKELAFSTVGQNLATGEQMRRFLSSFIAKNLRPNLSFDKVETDRKIRDALSSLEPVRIRRGQFIVREGDIVTADQVQILTKLGMMGNRVRASTVLGAALMAFFFVGPLVVYLPLFYDDIMAPMRAALAFSVVLLSVLVVKALTGISGFFAPTVLGVMLSTTLFDRRFGILLGTCLTLVVGVVTGFEVRFLVLALAGTLAASAAIRPAWSRSHLLKTGLLVAVFQGGVYLALGLIGVVPMGDIVSSWKDPLYLLLSGPFSSVLAIGLLPLFESVFGILTPIRLIELSNPEHPLLHRMLIEAPGTYHHSIMVGNLAEAAAWAVGADSLLTRVGAYYHDIGKIKRPYFFVENQVPGIENPHDKMNPALSATVIMAHVKNGLELSEEHKVPKVIQDFIAEHHGTTLVSYFYSKAQEKENDRLPEEWDYRYEGPRPHTKETAILMLADSVEAATRSLSKPTPARIESVVRKIIDERLSDHQLDKADITLKELDIIADTFTKVLTGIFHTRIEYPEKPSR